MTKVFQEPECAGRANARLFVVYDDWRGRIDPVHGKHVLDHPHECCERRRIGINEADPPEVEMDCARDVTRRIRLWWSEIEHQRRRHSTWLEQRRQIARAQHEMRVRVAVHDRQSYKGKGKREKGKRLRLERGA